MLPYAGRVNEIDPQTGGSNLFNPFIECLKALQNLTRE